MANAASKSNRSFTEEQAKVLLGKHVLVGVTHCNSQGVTVSQEQFHGLVERANPNEGLVVRLNGSNELRAVPLDVSALKMARPGEYRLTGTEEIVEDPDYTMQLTLHSGD